MILPCSTCASWGHDQDQLHGRGLRVHNQLKDPNKARCTVCGNVRTTGKAMPVVKETTKEVAQ